MAKTPSIEIEGFEKQQTIAASEQEGGEAEWITPDKGTTVQGKLTRTFLFKNTTNEGKPFQAAYEFTDADGHKWLLSERAAYKDAIRECHIGDEVIIIFKDCVEVPGKGKREMWEVDFYTKQADKKSRGKNVLDILKVDYKRQLEATPF